MNNSSKVIEFLYNSSDKNVRVDAYVASKIDSISRSYIKKIILEGALFINSYKINNPSYSLTKGEKIKIIFPEVKKDKPEPQNLPLNILYEDKHLLVINKSAGMVVHPGAGNYNNTLVNALLYHCKDSLSGIGGVLRPGIVHRLDKDTSGLMLVAKDDFSHRALAKDISLKKVKRIYNALVWGKPMHNSGRINLNIGRDTSDRKKMKVVNIGGRSAITDYTLIESYKVASLLECSLQTGRTHQIRVHLSYEGIPIIGDKLYAKGRTVSNKLSVYIKNFGRQALHSVKISFIHPINKKTLIFDTHLPEDINTLKKELENII